MIDVENSFSPDEEDELYDAVEFDPEATIDTTLADDDGDVLAFHDAMRDIWAEEGRFELLLP